MSVLALVAMVAVDRVGWPDPHRVKRGLAGERAVAAALEELLPEGFVVEHDVDTGHGNIDHVVIGPTGMFVLETKDWQRRFYPSAGRLFHNGRDAHDAVTQAQRAAMEVKQRPAAAGLPRVWVEAWVVSTRATIQGAKGGVLTLDRVTVRQLPGLADAVRAGNGRLTPVEVARARAAVLRWDRGPVTVRSLSG